MSNNALLTPAVITKETLMMLENNLVAAARVNRKFENQFVKIGSQLTIRKPNRFTLRRGTGISVQNITEPSTSITISNQTGVDMEFSIQDLTLTIEEFSERYCKPAAATISNGIDMDVLALQNQIFNQVGTAGVAPSGMASIALVGQRMDEGGVPQDGRALIFGPKAYWTMVVSLVANNFVQSVAEPAYKGFLARLGNFDIYLDQNIPLQTYGAQGGTPLVATAGQTGGTLVTNGWTASVTGIVNIGDCFTIQNVFAVNPQSRQSTQSLMNFTVAAVANSDSGGNSTLTISPSIVTSGAYQNVTASPASGATITMLGSASTAYAQNIAFVKDTFGLVTVPLELPNGVDFAARETYRGISMNIVRAFDITNYTIPTRLDVLYGVAAYYPETGVRLTN